MMKRTLGRTGLEVNLLGFGGIPLQRLLEEEAIQVVRHALNSGINFIDTARAYTDSESKIGKGIQGYPRESFYLASKTLTRTREAMAQDIETSLGQLQTEYIDLYQCHNVRSDADEEAVMGPGGALEALIEAKAQGKIRHIGVTSHQVDRLVRMLKTGYFDTIQVPYNFNELQAEENLLKAAQDNNIGVIIMKPLGGGALPAHLSLRFFNDKAVSVIIPGMDTLEQIDENLQTVSETQPLTEAELEEMDAFRKTIGQHYCRRCDYCRPCPEGIDISNLFLFHGYYTRYNIKEWSLARYKSAPVKPEACVECGLCESRCPYNLPIREMLKEVGKDMNAALKLELE